jgi:putative hydrolase of the HAD superfamily
MRYIFFDVDGVLIKGFSATAGERLRWDKDLRRDLGIDPDLLNAVFFERLFDDVITGRRDLEKALQDILPELGYQGMPQTLIDYWLDKDSILNEETLNIVRQLKAQPGARLFLATHQEKNRANYLWHNLGFKEYFEEIFFSGRMGLRKTNPDFFNKIENELCLEEAECLLIDDNAQVCEAAQKAGWKTILFRTPEDIKHLVAV